MTKNKRSWGRPFLAASALAFFGAPAQAHIIGIGWSTLPSGDVQFDALHWHGDLSGSDPIGDAALLVNGNNFGFTSWTNNVGSYDADGALINSTYSSFDGTSLSALNDPTSDNDWLHVTVPGSEFGETNTLGSTSGPGQLSVWNVDGEIQEIDIEIEPPPSTEVPTPSGLLLLASGLLGFVRFGRFRQ